ncbi:hypothetical protein ACFL5Z_14215 [Planctomycetota bacterium]
MQFTEPPFVPDTLILPPAPFDKLRAGSERSRTGRTTKEDNSQ